MELRLSLFKVLERDLADVHLTLQLSKTCKAIKSVVERAAALALRRAIVRRLQNIAVQEIERVD